MNVANGSFCVLTVVNVTVSGCSGAERLSAVSKKLQSSWRFDWDRLPCLTTNSVTSSNCLLHGHLIDYPGLFGDCLWYIFRDRFFQTLNVVQIDVDLTKTRDITPLVSSYWATVFLCDGQSSAWVARLCRKLAYLKRRKPKVTRN